MNATQANSLLSIRQRRAARRHLRQRAREAFAFTETDLVSREVLPEHDGVRLAHLTDLHIGVGTPRGRLRAAINAVNVASPDLVVITGDIVTGKRVSPLSRVWELEGITAPVYATLGNHDHWVDATGVRRRLEQMGYVVLQNENVAVPIRGAPLTLIGIDDAHTGHDDVARAFSGAAQMGSRVVLTHTPPTADKLPPAEDLICLAGHTHGGQLVIPVITKAILKLFRQPYMAGLHRIRGNTLYVNRGLGFGLGGPPRFGSPPEVAMLTLRRGVS